jgi:DnaA family protein
MTVRQLPIPLAVSGACDFASFRTGDNAELLAQLRTLALLPDGIGLWLWGEGGSGRSHLLQALCQEATSHQYPAIYLPLATLAADPEAIDGLEGGVIAIDDVELWLGDRRLETALMALYQRQLTSTGVLVVAAGSAAVGANFALPDLASRLRALPSFRVQPLGDADLVAVLKAAAHQRGLILNKITADFWITRSRRSLPTLLAELDELDRVALAAQRRLTIPLLKDVLKL